MKWISERCPVEIVEVRTRLTATDIEYAEIIVGNTDARKRRQPFERIVTDAGNTYQFAPADVLSANRWREAFPPQQ